MSILCTATTDFSVEAMVRDQLPCRRERDTSEDPFAVALMKGEMIVGHARDLAVASSRRCALQLLAHFLVSSLAAGLTVAD